MNDEMRRALEDGEKLLREMEERAAERERKRKEFVTIQVPVRRDADGVMISRTERVPRSSLPGWRGS